MKEKTNIAMAVVLVLLIVVSGVQAYTLGDLKGTMEDNQVSISSGGSTPNSGGGASKTTSSLPKSIQDLPQMVGGC